MTYPSDDLAPLLAEAPTPAVKYGQGRIVGWSPDTFDNTVEWRGQTFTNLPVLSGTEALTYQQDDEVILLGLTPGDGASTWFILGRSVIPGTDAATRAIEFMRGSLAKQISAEVFAERVFTAEVNIDENTSSTSYVALGDGPEIADVTISEAGLAVVFVSCEMDIFAIPAEGGRGGLMSHIVSGATSRAPNDGDAFKVLVSDSDAAEITLMGVRAASFAIQSGLNPGVHTFSSRYRSAASTSTAIVFRQRKIMVIAF